MRYPVNGVVTRGFSGDHQAIDISTAIGAGRSAIGAPILAPHAGVISAAGAMGDCGQGIDVDGGKFKSRLCHNSQLLLGVGTQVSEGQLIAKLGYSGYVLPAGPDGAHTHWVLWDNGNRVDPELYVGVPSSGMEEENKRLRAFVEILEEEGTRRHLRHHGLSEKDISPEFRRSMFNFDFSNPTNASKYYEALDKKFPIKYGQEYQEEIKQLKDNPDSKKIEQIKEIVK